jgi:hypothetical protein
MERFPDVRKAAGNETELEGFPLAPCRWGPWKDPSIIERADALDPAGAPRAGLTRRTFAHTLHL